MKPDSHKMRLIVVAIFFILIVLIILARAVDLTILNRKFLKNQGDARTVRTLAIPAYRGMITDREGVPLAISTPLQSAWINPKEFTPTDKQLELLSSAVQISQKVIMKKMMPAHREFLYLQRHMLPAAADFIKTLKIPGLYFLQEYKRYYPEADSVAQLLGFTNIDDVGIEGLELAYQDWLMGIPGKRRVIIDPIGRVVDDLGIIQQPRPGHDLSLSIDRRIQYLAYHELKETLKQFKAKAGSVVVLDVSNGEILAAANAPSYNPNVRDHYELNRYRNKAFTDLFEPGSVIKPFSIASALHSKKVTPETIIDTRPGWMVVDRRMVRDIHNYGVLDVTGVLQRSSNVGVTKMILQNPPEQLIHLLMNAGFGQVTESGYPGESGGSIVSVKEAKPFVLATLGFGYGLSVTALQLAKAYMIFANHGYLKPVSLIHNQSNGPEQAVLDVKTADQILTMMEAVLDNGGTGKAARVPGYRVAGKTGTARIVGKNGYEKNRHIGSFVGIAPVSNPRLIVVVVIYEPTQNSYFGGAVAGPLFAKVMTGALRILNVPPDQTSGENA